MNLRNTSQKYGFIHMLLHWLMAFIIIGELILGLYMHGNPKLYFVHKSLGVFVFILVTLRIIWKILNIKPEFDRKIPTLMRMVSKIGTFALYGFMISMPLTGILMSLFAGYPVPYFGMFEIPAFIAKNISYAKFFKETHEVLAFSFMGLILIHTLMALVHHYYFKDNTLKKMLPKLSEN